MNCQTLQNSNFHTQLFNLLELKETQPKKNCLAPFWCVIQENFKNLLNIIYSIFDKQISLGIVPLKPL